MYSLTLDARYFWKLNRAMLLSLVAIFPALQAKASSCQDTSCKIPVQFQGIYQEETCEISIDGKGSSETVTLPKLGTSVLQKDGAEAGGQIFNISLKGCPINRTIALRFISAGTVADTATGNMVNTTGDGYSKNVQIRLRNEATNQMIIDNTDSVQNYDISDQGEDVTHQFSASYYAKGTSAVTAGLVSTTASIDLIYK